MKTVARSGDPAEVISTRARKVVYEALEEGWSGPPFDPFELADRFEVEVVAVEELEDARLVSGSRGRRIEFNPNRPPARVRFSVAHELAHLLFPDADAEVRYRSPGRRTRRDDWQLELLCNLGAAEFLMPIGAFADLQDQPLEINSLLELRSAYGVSTEALLRRVVGLAPDPAAVFAAARDEADQDYRIDYTVPSRAWGLSAARGAHVGQAVIGECSAVGWTAKGNAVWGEALNIECVGVPPYPGQKYPRVIGIVRPLTKVSPAPALSHVHGDATVPRGEPPWIIAHVVNDKARRWGPRGFARSLARRYPDAPDAFREWAREGISLGDSQVTEVGQGQFVFSMVAQRGFGESSKPRIRYAALERCFIDLWQFAREQGASVHVPLIGSGQAGGRWSTVSDLLLSRVARDGVAVTVYRLPEVPLPDDDEAQLALGS